MASLKESVEAALNNVAPDGDSWTEGWNQFWYELQDGANLGEALDSALVKANGDRTLPEKWLRASRNEFWRTYKRKTAPRVVDQPEPDSSEPSDD